jgi:hypothetical protein
MITKDQKEGNACIFPFAGKIKSSQAAHLRKCHTDNPLKGAIGYYSATRISPPIIEKIKSKWHDKYCYLQP